MTEAERRRRYVASRALIEASRVLATTFDDADLYFTGPQIEIMRNLMQYANRPETYVSEYESGYYLIPDDTDWDAIQSIVADLEETLMGNPNTLWGYVSVYHRAQDDTSDVNGTFIVNLPKPSAGTIVRVLGMSVYRGANAGTTARLQVNYPGGGRSLEEVDIVAIGLCYPNTREFIVTDADNIRVMYRDATVDEFVHTCAWGYVMLVS